MNKEPEIYVAYFIIGTFIFALILFYFASRTDRYWTSGRIPPSFIHTADNEMEIIIALAGIIIRKDFKDVLLKRQYLRDYFARYFTMENYNLNETLRDSYIHPLKIEEITKWFNKYQVSEHNKLNIVQLMVDISMLDGELNGHEYDTLKYLHNLLNLPIEEFDRMMHIHLQQEERRRERERKNTNIKSTYVSESAKSLACKILGVSMTDSIEEIKKAYRDLVKKHHPDKFANGTTIQIKVAHERFLEIQKAYEILER